MDIKDQSNIQAFNLTKSELIWLALNKAVWKNLTEQGEIRFKNLKALQYSKCQN